MSNVEFGLLLTLAMLALFLFKIYVLKTSGRHSVFQLRTHSSLSSPKNNDVQFILDYL